MTKLATSVEDQLIILQTRGMKFDEKIDVLKAKEILSDIGYYRLGFYWHFFEEDIHHNFIQNLYFSTIVNLYYLDIDLKHLITKALNRIEIHFRTQIIYEVSNKYKSDPFWFNNSSVVNNLFIGQFDDKCYTNTFKKNLGIKKHHIKYPEDKYAPAWKTIEYMSFGSVEFLFNSLLDNELKELIANKYGINNLRVFTNYLNTLVFVRNICAHSGILYDTNTRKAIKISPLVNVTNENKHSLFSCIEVVLYFWKCISLERSNELRNEIEKIFENHYTDDLIKSIIDHKIKYKKNQL
jgi:abortive infection bacteriophage resistance protein